MRRFLVTSDSYRGQVEIIYNADQLCGIDFSGAELQPKVLKIFKDMVPVELSNLKEAFSKTKATIVECDFEVSFDMFWKKYDRKINRKRAERIFGKLSKSNQVAAYFGIDAYDRYLKAESWRSKADPEKYLKDEYWNNEWSK